MKSTFRSTLLWIALLAGLPVSSTTAGSADYDDGLRSIFAHGAGNRALAMGGAFTAMGEGPGVIIWNPAGLSRQQYYAVSSTQTDLIGLGFSERYLAAVMPSWRYGNSGIALRTFGVGGIEERDDRNILLNDDLKDSETELLLGYARDMGRALSVGLGVKYRNHSLAGYSGSGFGLDLGLRFLPLSLLEDAGQQCDLSLGVVMRNLVEPKIQLDQDNVPDPRSLALGLACSRPLGAGLRALLVADLEKTADMDMDYHLGGEVWIRDILALRAGLNRDIATFGFGVTYLGLSVDYAFEDNPLDPVQRLGLGVRFGARARQRRIDYEYEQEAQRREQMAAALAQRDQQQLEGMIAASRVAEASGDLVQAMDLMAMADMLEPGNEMVITRLLELKRLQARRLEEDGDLVSATVVWRQILAEDATDKLAIDALARISDRQNEISLRTNELRGLYDRSMDAFAMGDLNQARDGFRELLAADPDDVQSSEMLKRLEDAFHARAGVAMDQAQIMAVAGRLDEADAALAGALQDWPQVPGADEIRDDIKTRRDQLLYSAQQQRIEAERARDMATLLGGSVAETPSGPGQAKARMTEKQSREMESLYEQAMRRAEEGKASEAIRIWELILSQAADYRDVSKLLCQEYLTRGMGAFAGGNLTLAVREWENALRVDPQDTRAQGYLQRAYKQQDRIQAIRDDG